MTPPALEMGCPVVAVTLWCRLSALVVRRLLRCPATAGSVFPWPSDLMTFVVSVVTRLRAAGSAPRVTRRDAPAIQLIPSRGLRQTPGAVVAPRPTRWATLPVAEYGLDEPSRVPPAAGRPPTGRGLPAGLAGKDLPGAAGSLFTPTLFESRSKPLTCRRPRPADRGHSPWGEAAHPGARILAAADGRLHRGERGGLFERRRQAYPFHLG